MSTPFTTDADLLGLQCEIECTYAYTPGEPPSRDSPGEAERLEISNLYLSTAKGDRIFLGHQPRLEAALAALIREDIKDNRDDYDPYDTVHYWRGRSTA